MKRRFKSGFFKILELIRLKETKVESAVKLEYGNAIRFHSLSVLTNLALENIGKEKAKCFYIAEAGIGYGETISFLATIAEKLDVKLVGFDSFKGFPEPTSPKDHRAWGPKTRSGEWNINSVEAIKKKLKKNLL